MRACIFLLLNCGLLIAAPVANPAKISFQRQIRPLLSENCFQCHGPDAASRMAGLRLDTREGAFAARKPGPALVEHLAALDGREPRERDGFAPRGPVKPIAIADMVNLGSKR